MRKKDFGPIESDYEFFMDHGTEAECDAICYARKLADFQVDRSLIRWLDFGCGSGGFIVRLLRKLNWSPERLKITLMEPVAHQLKFAVERVAPFTQHPLTTWEHFPTGAGTVPEFDLAVSNHVLYYVEDLEKSVTTLRWLTKPGGKLMLAMAGLENGLVQLWKSGFDSLREEIPFYICEDLEQVLVDQNYQFSKTPSRYQLRFPDSEENRMKILRFLFGSHLDRMSQQLLFDEMGQWVVGNTFEMHTVSYLYEVECP
ncbi:class I SAM-dependent methyltransferase [Bremerella sp. JC817]|uniref:class I SAM-dependent methyltransferase n=1 Tax=Bremerella sp. JC817 TaxID=3231756 RepID=UPI003459568B